MAHLDNEPQEDGTKNENRGENQLSFDPNQIRITSNQLSLEYVLGELRSNNIDLEPAFQREKGIWEEDDQSRLIESLLIRIPIPAFYFDATDENKWVVIDGVQRLTAFARFVLDEKDCKELLDLDKLKLDELEFLKELNHTTFDELNGTLKRRIMTTQLTINIIESGTPQEVTYNIFRRINTGGLTLSPQEDRNARNAGQATEFLAELSNSPEFLNVTDRRLTDRRGKDQECILRFIAFTSYSYLDYQEYEQKHRDYFDQFLKDTMAHLNVMECHELDNLRATFKKAMVAAHRIFGGAAFRRVQAGQINEALFEVWSVMLGELSKDHISKLIGKKEYLMYTFDDLLKDDVKFKGSLSGKKPQLVETRFESIDTLIQLVLDAPDPWENIEEKYPINSVVETAEVVTVSDAEIKVRLEADIAVLIDKSELWCTEVNPRLSKYFEVGDRVKAVVLNIDRSKKQILLSHVQAVMRNYDVNTEVEVQIIKIYKDSTSKDSARVELERGIRGWIYTSELSWTDEGKKVKAVVSSIDRDKRRILLSYRQTQSNP